MSKLVCLQILIMTHMQWWIFSEKYLTNFCYFVLKKITESWKFVSDVQQVGGFLLVLWFPSNNKTEILLNTITLPLLKLQDIVRTHLFKKKV